MHTRFNTAMFSRGPALRVVLLGPPGSGKGTQATRICERYGMVHVSTGDILRRHTQEKTELGLLARAYMEAGQLVPNDLICQMIVDLYRESGGAHQSFVFDGFPRSRNQAEALSTFLASQGEAVHQVVMLELDDEEIVDRLTKRRTCPQCGRSYHLSSCPPKTEGVCDVDRASLIHRSDDHESVIRKRLKTYHEQTLPVAEFYEKLGLLHRVSASAGIDAVEAAIARLLSAWTTEARVA